MKINFSKKQSLLKQIELQKNYRDHQNRINHYNQTIKLDHKCISFNQKQSEIFKKFKQRNSYNKNFIKLEKCQKDEYNDSRMLHKMISNEKHLFSFSLRNARHEDRLLHHNSSTMSKKVDKNIEQQNGRLFIRICSTKSRYNNLQSLRKSCSGKAFSPIVKTTHSQVNQRDSRSAIKFHEDLLNAEESDGKRYQYKNAPTESSQLTEIVESKFGHSHKYFKLVNNFSHTLNSKIQEKREEQKLLCQRLRTEKVATTLYQRKLILQQKVIKKVQDK